MNEPTWQGEGEKILRQHGSISSHTLRGSPLPVVQMSSRLLASSPGPDMYVRTMVAENVRGDVTEGSEAENVSPSETRKVCSTPSTPMPSSIIAPPETPSRLSRHTSAERLVREVTRKGQVVNVAPSETRQLHSTPPAPSPLSTTAPLPTQLQNRYQTRPASNTPRSSAPPPSPLQRSATMRIPNPMSVRQTKSRPSTAPGTNFSTGNNHTRGNSMLVGRMNGGGMVVPREEELSEQQEYVQEGTGGSPPPSLVNTSRLPSRTTGPIRSSMRRPSTSMVGETSAPAPSPHAYGAQADRQSECGCLWAHRVLFSNSALRRGSL